MQQREGQQVTAQAKAQEKQSEQQHETTHITGSVVCKRYTAAQVKLYKGAAFVSILPALGTTHMVPNAQRLFSPV
jgi:hypothetical protein